MKSEFHIAGLGLKWLEMSGSAIMFNSFQFSDPSYSTWQRNYTGCVSV